jgi:hypothetical protein
MARISMASTAAGLRGISAAVQMKNTWRNCEDRFRGPARKAANLDDLCEVDRNGDEHEPCQRRGSTRLHCQKRLPFGKRHGDCDITMGARNWGTVAARADTMAACARNVLRCKTRLRMHRRD